MLQKIYIIKSFTPYDYGASIIAAYSSREKAQEHFNKWNDLKSQLEQERARLNIENWTQEDWTRRAPEMVQYFSLEKEIMKLAGHDEVLQIIEKELL